MIKMRKAMNLEGLAWDLGRLHKRAFYLTPKDLEWLRAQIKTLLEKVREKSEERYTEWRV